MKNALFPLMLFGSLLILEGCSGVSQSGKPDANAASAPVSSADEASRRMGMQHFVDASVFELKGDLPQAILEYQDALRFDKDPAIYYAISRCYSQLSKHSLAIENAREAVRLSPEQLTYRRNLADVLAAAFDFDAAAQQFEELIKRDSAQVEVWYNLARLYQQRKPLRALEVYQHIIDRFGPDWDVFLQVADLNNRMGRFDKAADALREMTLIDPSNKELKKTLAQTYARAGKFDEALKVYDDLRDIHPDDLEIQAEVAGLYLARGEHARAAKEFDTLLARDSVSIEVKVHIGEMYFAQTAKDSTLAPVTRSIFEQIAAKHPDDWRAFWFLGAIGSVTHDDSLSLRSFRRVTELASWNADAWVYMSGVFLVKNNFSEVVRILESAVRILPDDFRVNFFLGLSYSRLNRNIDAARALEHARQLNPKDLDAIAQLALVYDTMRRFEDSDALYEEALKADPENHLVLNNFAYSLADRNLQLERALNMSRKAVDAQPDNASYLDTIGWIYFRLGRYAEAETWTKTAISKGEVNAVVYEHLGDIYFRMNQRDLAIEHWNMALKLDEQNSQLRDKIARGSL
jgi:pentatricopeptide repeat protein